MSRHGNGAPAGRADLLYATARNDTPLIDKIAGEGQAKNRERAGPKLRLVKCEPRPEPPRLEVRIAAYTRRQPYGRSRPFLLTERGLDDLLSAALRIEREARR